MVATGLPEPTGGRIGDCDHLDSSDHIRRNATVDCDHIDPIARLHQATNRVFHANRHAHGPETAFARRWSQRLRRDHTTFRDLADNDPPGEILPVRFADKGANSFEVCVHRNETHIFGKKNRANLNIGLRYCHQDGVGSILQGQEVENERQDRTKGNGDV